MIDHIVIGVSDLNASREFYLKALEPLGIGIVMEFQPHTVGFGVEGKPTFWIGTREPGPMHIAFASPDHETVDKFYEAAVAAGGKDNGPPGFRPIYHERYYGAFVHDPDGYNVEAVCHWK